MKMHTLMGIMAGAALGMAAGYAAREMGGVSTRQVRHQAKRAVRAMEQAADRLSWSGEAAVERTEAAAAMTQGIAALHTAMDFLSYRQERGRY